MDKAIVKNVPPLPAAGKLGLSAVRDFFRRLAASGKPSVEDGSSERRELLHDLDRTLADLRYARSCFENARDPEVIEACVYEIKSAETRYSFLLKKAKLLGERASAPTPR